MCLIVVVVVPPLDSEDGTGYCLIYSRIVIMSVGHWNVYGAPRTHDSAMFVGVIGVMSIDDAAIEAGITS